MSEKCEKSEKSENADIADVVLACQGLTKIYREGAAAEVRVLNGVDLEISAG